jgi:hypothetical protein
MKGIMFGNYHSWNDFQLILASKTIGTPSPKTETIDIPGGDGVLDLTEFFGETKYNNRNLSFEFSSMVNPSEFMTLFSMVQNALHGKKMTITLDDDPGWYYIGRISVSEWKTDRNIGKLTIDCDCEPYKLKSEQTSVSVTLDGTSKNMYDTSTVPLPVTIKKDIDDFLLLDVNNTSSGILYPTLMHKVYASGEVLPNQVMSFVMEIRESQTVPKSGIYFYYTNYYAPQPDYFAPRSYPVLFTNTKDKIVVIPAVTSDESAIASAAFFLRSYFSIQSGASIKAKFRLSVVQGTVNADDFVYTSADGTMKGLQLVNGRKRAVPTIATTSPFTIYHEGNTYSVGAGTFMIPEIELKEGVNDVAVKGSGTITFTWQEGDL